MLYIAQCYVDRWTPGEVIHGIPEESAERLLKRGAIRAIDLDEERLNEIQREAMGGKPAETEVPDGKTDAEASENEPEGMTGPEEPERLEIDAMDAVVAADEPEAPKKSTRRKSSKKED